MKKTLTLAAALLFAVVSVGAADQTTESELAAYLDPDALLELIHSPPDDFHLVDVRTPPEYESGHIPGAANFELAFLEQRRPTEDRDALLVVYCRSGSRSARAAQLLDALGYTRVLDWGGVGNWPYELITGPDPQ
jgi:rhodanese-related sulfurtransferase